MNELNKKLEDIRIEISWIIDRKNQAIREQRWEDASDLRDLERSLLKKEEYLKETVDFSKLSLQERARKFAVNAHKNINQKYDEKPYEFHLEMVVNNIKKYIKLIPKNWVDKVIAAGWTHDVVEDTTKRYEDVINATNKDVADLTYAVTNKGKRGDDKYYQKIKDTPYATFIKLCDRISNVEHCLRGGNKRLYDMYKKENKHFKEYLQVIGKYDIMWEYLDSLFKKNNF